MYEDVNIYDPTICRARSIGKDTKIGAFCDIGKNVEIGKGCNIQAHVTISNGTKIGNGVFIAPGVQIYNDKYMNGLLQPPIIEDYCRIGGGTKILPGVTIGKNAFIGADSLITKDVPAGMVVIGKW